MPTPLLYYVHDPMCSWCWGFAPCWQHLQHQLGERVEIRYLLGGLAADNDQPMAESMQRYLQDTWRRIETQIPGIHFNFDFWQHCQPRRSTYPACRAVITAREQDPALEKPMIQAIQQAYYLQARNPSDNETLIDCAVQLGLDAQRFSERLYHPETRQQLMNEIQQSERLGVAGYPSLVLVMDNEPKLIELDYLRPEPMLEQINRLLAG